MTATLTEPGPGASLQPAAIRSILDRRAFRTVFQPIVELESRAIVGYEALTRISDGTPTDVFDARERGTLRVIADVEGRGEPSGGRPRPT